MSMMPRRIVAGRDDHTLINSARPEFLIVDVASSARILRRLFEVVFCYLQVMLYPRPHHYRLTSDPIFSSQNRGFTSAPTL